MDRRLKIDAVSQVTILINILEDFSNLNNALCPPELYGSARPQPWKKFGEGARPQLSFRFGKLEISGTQLGFPFTV